MVAQSMFKGTPMTPNTSATTGFKSSAKVVKTLALPFLFSTNSTFNLGGVLIQSPAAVGPIGSINKFALLGGVV